MSRIRELVAFRREHTGVPLMDRVQRQTQEATQKINTLAGRFTLVSLATASITADVATTSTTFVDVAGLSVSLSALAGDLLLIDCSTLGGSTGASGRTHIAVVDGGATYSNASANSEGRTLGSSGWYTSTIAVVSPHVATWTVRKSGTVTVKLQAAAGAAATLTLYAAAGGTGGVPMLRVQQMRAH